jgi:hypothetical protein
MNTVNTVTIRGDLAVIYGHAANVERWPTILPHYRSVHILEAGVGHRLVSMACVRPFGFVRWPCRWRARQDLLPEEGRILYSHLSGPAIGMKVEWTLREKPEGVETSIRHELSPKGNPLSRFYCDRILGSIFVQSIAGQTLATIKRLVEAGELT